MKRIILAVVIITLMFTSTVNASTSDKDLANAWMNKHCKGAHIEVVKTTSKGGHLGKVNGTKCTVHYPKKVKKGHKVTVYMIVKNDDVKAMVCLGKVK